MAVDRVGIGLLAIGVGSLQVMLDRGKDLDWLNSPAIVALAAAAVVGLAFFVVWELTDDQPAVDLRLFAGRNFTAGTVALCLGFAVYFGNIVLLPLWLQTQLAYTPTWAGLASAPVGVLPVMLVPFVGRYMHRVDLRWLATASLAAFAAAAFWYAGFDAQVSFGELAWSRFAQGVGLALFFTPLMTIVLSGLPASRVASAAGLADTLRTLAGTSRPPSRRRGGPGARRCTRRTSPIAPPSSTPPPGPRSTSCKRSVHRERRSSP